MSGPSLLTSPRSSGRLRPILTASLRCRPNAGMRFEELADLRPERLRHGLARSLRRTTDEPARLPDTARELRDEALVLDPEPFEAP